MYFKFKFLEYKIIMFLIEAIDIVPGFDEDTVQESKDCGKNNHTYKHCFFKEIWNGRNIVNL